MKLYLVRHGESEANLDYNILKTKRDEDIELTPKGYQDALKAGMRLKEVLTKPYDYHSFLVSPWTRALQTFTIINGVLGGKCYGNEHHGVTEHYMNLVNNPKNWETFEKYKASDWNVGEYMDTMYDGGESLRGVRNRAQLLVDELRQANKDSGVDGVVVVCHGQFIKQVISLVKGIDPNDLVHPANGEVVVLEI